MARRKSKKYFRRIANCPRLRHSTNGNFPSCGPSYPECAPLAWNGFKIKAIQELHMQKRWGKAALSPGGENVHGKMLRHQITATVASAAPTRIAWAFRAALCADTSRCCPTGLGVWRQQYIPLHVSDSAAGYRS
jgi:hypothetical protein